MLLTSTAKLLCPEVDPSRARGSDPILVIVKNRSWFGMLHPTLVKCSTVGGSVVDVQERRMRLESKRRKRGYSWFIPTVMPM